MDRIQLQKLRDLPIEGVAERLGLKVVRHKAIAIPSATLLSKKDVNLLQTLSSELSVRCEMYPDRDAPHQLPPGCKDFSDYYLSVVATRH